MRMAYLDCFSGISGDMMLGALVGAGADLGELEETLRGLHLDGWSLKQGDGSREHRVPGTDVEVVCGEDHVHRTFRDIRGMIEQSDLTDTVKQRSVEVFHRLAVAEGKVHGKDPEEVSFHEVGAVDSIVDIVGCVAGLERLGIERLSCSPLPLGGGTVRCRHGQIPIPAPATAELLVGVPTVPGEERRELVTPTGAALATTLATGFGPMPAMTVEAVGYGLGKVRGHGLPNALRLFVGSASVEGEVPQDVSLVLEANIDDMPGELFGPLLQQLLDAGAQDAYYTPVQMKKGRPGLLVTVLCAPVQRNALEAVLFHETTTIGVRRHRVWRSCLERSTRVVRTRLGEVRIKECTGLGGVLNRMPEFEDCHTLARKHGLAIREVHELALAAARAEEP